MVLGDVVEPDGAQSTELLAIVEPGERVTRPSCPNRRAGYLKLDREPVGPRQDHHRAGSAVSTTRFGGCVGGLTGLKGLPRRPGSVPAPCPEHEGGRIAPRLLGRPEKR